MKYLALCLLVGAAVPRCLGASVVQCPDGSPPPCGRTTTSVAGRVPNLALNDNTWLVLPFENTARSTDAELIRQASVSQLYGELSRWSGVRVISDDRVADLLHAVPAAQLQQLGLETARNLARRVGAGRIVLGQFLAAGGRANLTAKVYDTRTGAEVRVVRGSMSGFTSDAALDSLTASFGRLARGILDVPPGTGGAVAGVGTSQIEAYRAYVAGMDFINRLLIDSARGRFARAVQLDSNYALAHLQLWRSISDSGTARPHLDAAMRLATGLPPRARVLVETMAAQRRQDREGICRGARELVESDSADAEGWSFLVYCHLDQEVVMDGERPRLKGDLNKALRAAERAYALAPASVGALGAMVNALQLTSYIVCVPATTAAVVCPPDRLFRVSILPAGDSLNVSINLWRDVKHAPPDQAPAAVAAQFARFRRLIAVCERLVQVGNTWLAHYVTSQVAIVAGDYATADAHAGRGIISGSDTSALTWRIYLRTRLDVALALERPAQINVYADSLFASPPPAFGPYRATMGRLGEVADTTTLNRQNTAWRQILTGVVPPGFDTLNQQLEARLSGAQREDYRQLTTLAGFHLGIRGPSLDTAARHPLKRYQAWFARGDLAKARTALAQYDRELLARDVHTIDDGGWLFSAESHAELGDSAVALDRMNEFARRWSTAASIPQDAYIVETRFYQSTTIRLAGRAWLLLGDLAMARNARAQARRAYTMVVALWERGDPVVQPMVARAKAALQQLGS